MTVDPTAMLRQLGLSGRTGAAQSAPQQTQSAGIQPGEFADLLQRARDGTLASNRPVTIEDGQGLNLNEAQLARLSLAADRAEAAGLRKALVMIDDQRVILDVQQRTIVAASASDSGVLDGIDGVLDLAGVLAPSADKTPIPGPPTAMENPNLARLLAQMNDRGRAA